MPTSKTPRLAWVGTAGSFEARAAFLTLEVTPLGSEVLPNYRWRVICGGTVLATGDIEWKMDAKVLAEDAAIRLLREGLTALRCN